MLRSFSPRLVSLLLACGAFAAECPALRAQSEPVPSSTPQSPAAAGVSAAAIEDLRQRAAAADLAEDVKQQIATLCGQALDDLKQADELARNAALFQTRKEGVAGRREELEDELALLQAADAPQPALDSRLATLETELLEHRHKLAAKTAEFDACAADQPARPARREALRAMLSAQPQQLETAARELAAPRPEGESPLLTAATRAAQEARKLRLERLPAAVQNELALYDAEDAHDVPRLRRELLDRQVAQLKRAIQDWEVEVAHKRRDAIARRIDAAEKGMESAAGVARDLFQQNLELVHEERRVRARAQETRVQGHSANHAIGELTLRFSQLKDRDRKAAGSTALGLRLRQQREQLVDPDDLRHAVASRIETVEDARLTALDYSDQLDKLADLEALVADFVLENPAPTGEVSELGWEDLIRFAFEQRKEFLTELEKAYDEYTDALDDLERDQEALASLSESVRDFIDERVLWIRSHRTVRPRGLFDEWESLAWLLTFGWVPETARVLKADLWHRPGWYALFVVVVAVLHLDRKRQRRQLDELATVVTSRLTVDVRPTLRAAFLSLLLAAFWPGILMFFAWRLGAAAERSLFSRDLGHNLTGVAWLLLLLEFTRQVVRVDGLGDAHFRWPARVRSRLQLWIRRMTRFGLPVMLVVACLNARESEVGGDQWERVGYAGVLLLLAWALRDLMHPQTGVLLDWVSRTGGGWLDKLRPVWGAISVGVPAALALLSLYGYHYTSQRLAEKLALTLALIEGVAIGWGMLTRWLRLRHRRLAIDQARARRAALAETATGAEESIARYVETTEQKADLSTSSTQSQRLINTSLTVLAFAAIWFVWADVLPALNYFNTATVWSSYETVIRAARLADASEVSSQVSIEIQSVTWADLIRALVVLVLTVTASRNLPGLLEMTVLEHLPIDTSVRFAVTTFARYTIALLGTVLVCSLLGLTWSSVQWLAAALTFGLAFGLQEIFANFVSGLIILFEQPVRVGDVVTIDNVTGSVSRIRIRSTTITDWDRKEYIVPNKEFITGKLLNWTLTDSVNRVVVPIGVSYSSDPDEVRRLILEVAEGLDNVLKDPAPSVSFEGFGDSALNFTLRVFLPNLVERIDTVHVLHTRIFQRFREAGIEIPFPQRDLHVRSVPKELAQALHRSHGETLHRQDHDAAA